MNLEYLSWDSDFFQKKIGKISYHTANELLFIKLLDQAKSEGYQLLYVFGDKNLNFDKVLLKKYHGNLIDRKVLYSKKIYTSVETKTIAQEYKESILTNEIEKLAFLSGMFSRYYTDKGFPPEDYYRLYKIWISRSISHEIADKVFVVMEKENPVGMITLKMNAGLGLIGLLAVSDKVQGKGIGKNLINACINELVSNQIYEIEVPTQIGNKVGCMFYEKCGFEIKSITNIFHFWL